MSAVEQRRARAFSWENPALARELAAGLSGLEYIAAIAAGEIPAPPFAHALESSLVEVERGRVVFAMEPAEWMYNPLGSVHGGIAAAILDSCMGCAVHTTLDAGVGFTTADLHVRYIRAMSEATGRVLAEGRIVHGGRRTATAEGRVFTESDERLIATATTGCIILR